MSVQHEIYIGDQELCSSCLILIFVTGDRNPPSSGLTKEVIAQAAVQQLPVQPENGVVAPASGSGCSATITGNVVR